MSSTLEQRIATALAVTDMLSDEIAGLVTEAPSFLLTKPPKRNGRKRLIRSRHLTPPKLATPCSQQSLLATGCALSYRG
jgi:hypothetical protein